MAQVIPSTFVKGCDLRGAIVPLCRNGHIVRGPWRFGISTNPPAIFLRGMRDQRALNQGRRVPAQQYKPVRGVFTLVNGIREG
jgi:hypothetical protein